MPKGLVKQAVNLPLAVGIDTKTDPFQLELGKFLALNNVIYTTDKQLKKRNGFQQLASLPTASGTSASGIQPTTLTTFSGALTAIGGGGASGASFYGYAPETEQWYNKGSMISLDLATAAIVRSATNQTQQDAAVTSTGLSCTVWNDSNGSCMYQVGDTTSNQILVPAVALPAHAAFPRVFVLAGNFIITYILSNNGHLQYIAVPQNNPTSPTTPVNLETNASSTGGYDGYVANNNLYLSYSASGTTLKTTYLSFNLVQGATVSIASQVGTFVSVTVDSTTGNVWVSWFNNSSNNIYAAVYSSVLTLLLAATVVVSSVSATNNITSVAYNGLGTIFYETNANYGYTLPGFSANAVTNYVSKTTITFGGTAGTPSVILRSVALAGKAFIAIDGNIYLAVAYGSNSPNNDNYEPTYFLINANGNVAAKFASSNGGGYPATFVLPGAWVYGSKVFMGYLYKDLLTSVNKTTSAGIPTSGIYSQTGINLATFTFNPSQIADAEIASNLFVTGGITWEYDGVKPVELGFNVWPEDIGFTYNASSTVTPTGTFTSGSFTVTVSSTSGIAVGMSITDTSHSSYIPAGTYISAISGTTLTITQATTNAGTNDNLSIQGNIAAQPDGATNTNAYAYQVTYEWTDAAGNIHRSAPSVPIFVTTTSTGSTGTISLSIPTYRITYKTGANVVRIVVYRWSVKNQVYYQVTPVASPLLNNTAVDSVTFVDPYSDAQILGNQIIYTNGGVVEDLAPPGCIDAALFNARLFLIDAEDRNLLWFSKQVIENVPVEMSDLFTYFVAPSIGAQGSTGDCTALAAMDDKLIIFKENALYYITGQGPDNTGAGSDFPASPLFITATVGCTNTQSIVFIPQGLMFQSDKGIWLLGRDLSTNYIGAPVEAFNSATVVSALTIPGTTQVRFTLDNQVTLMYDYYFDRWGTFLGIPGVSSTQYQDLHTYINEAGAVFQETPGEYLDGSHPVVMSFTTGWLNLAGLQGYERIYHFLLLANYLSPHLLQIGVAYNYNSSVVDMMTIRPDNFNEPFGDDAGDFGDVGPFGGNITPENWRVFFGKQKCESLQISVQEQFDPSFGTEAGAGLTFSGICLVAGMKKGYRPIKAANSVGGSYTGG